MAISFKKHKVLILLGVFLLVFVLLSKYVHDRFSPYKKKFVPVVTMHHMGKRYVVNKLYLNKEPYGRILRSGNAEVRWKNFFLPEKWRPGIAVDLRWSVTDFGSEDVSVFLRKESDENKAYKAMVPIEFYDNAEGFCVHIFPHGKARVIPGNCKEQFPKGYYEDEKATQAKVVDKLLTNEEFNEMIEKIPRNNWK